MFYKFTTIILAIMLIVCIGYIIDNAMENRKEEDKSHEDED